MISIFYDFETSDKDYIGQILNFAFVVVDESWNELDRLVGNIKIKRTELPAPDAIAVNRIDVIHHQKIAEFSEFEAVKIINSFLNKYTNRVSNEQIPLIGYNSNGFDLQYLRTTFIRNGYSPYFKNIIYSDLLHTTKYCFCFNKDFGDRVWKNCFGVNNNQNKLNLKLSFLIKCFLNIEQTHDSLDDVLNSIKLAKFIKDNYSIDCRTLSCYMPTFVEHEIIEVYPNYDYCEFSLDSNYLNVGRGFTRKILLDQDNRYAIWVDVRKCIEKFLELGWDEKEFVTWCSSDNVKTIVQWYNKNNYNLFTANENNISDSFSLELLEQKKFLETFDLKKLLHHISLKEFFGDKDVDAEQNIYCIPFSDIDYLKDAIRYNNIDRLIKCGVSSSKKLYNRFLINECDNVDDNSELLQVFMAYCQNRYRGKMKLTHKNECYTYTDTIKNRLLRIKELSKEDKNKKLMKSLKQFYVDSDVIKVLS